MASRFAEVELAHEGAEGGVLRALDLDAGRRRVALKRVPAERVHALRRAFALLHEVASPHLPEVHELLASDDGGAVLVTAWIEGESLGPGPVPPARALSEALAVAHALAAIHGRGTHHGDVSAGNVVVTPTRGVVLVDLGQLGSLGTGTPGFLAPEVLGGGGGPAADRFALGCLLCLRLFGEVPWRRPELLVAVRGRTEVEARIDALATAHAIELAPGIRALLERLLDPDPAHRAVSTPEIVAHLGRLHAAAAGGIDAPPITGWWMPSRFPYRGAALEPVLARLGADDRPRLVVVAGPVGSGRARVVEELVHRLQGAAARAGAPVARLCTRERAADAFGEAGLAWLDAWIESPRDDLVVGLSSVPSWPRGLEDAPARTEAAVDEVRARVLAGAASRARSALVMAVSPELGRSLRALAVPEVAVLEVRPWDQAELGAAVGEVVDTPDPTAWIEAVGRLTGGWPARITGLLRACATAGLQRPDPDRLAGLLAGPSVPDLDPTMALEILEAAWGDADALAGLPPEHGELDRVAPYSVDRARRVIGPELRARARVVLEARGRQGGVIPLRLALDAADATAVAEVLAATLADRGRELELDRDPDLAELARFVAGRRGEISGELRAVIQRSLIRRGEARSALDLGGEPGDAADAIVQRIRAELVIGRPAEALTLCDAVDPADRELAAETRGHALRALCDLGRSGEAFERAQTLDELPDGLGGAIARLWAGHAALLVGEPGLAEVRLTAAAEVAAAHPRGAAVSARALQLLGNLAHQRGQVERARTCHAAAADAFARAGERVGRLMLRGSLAPLCFLTGEVSAGAAHARAAFFGLLALDNLQALSAAARNLVLLLLRIGAAHEADDVRALLAAVLAGRAEDSGIARARLLRIDADLVEAEVREGRSGADALEPALLAAAHALSAAEAHAEAASTWIAAAAVARRLGHLDTARTALERARAGADDTELARVELERAAVDAADLEPWTRLRALPDAAELRARGDLEHARLVDAALLPLLRARLGAGHPAVSAVARRLAETLEQLMSKASVLDRPGVKAALGQDLAGQAALEAMVAELAAGAPGPAATTAEPPARPGEGPERLLRMYRRLAREDRLEPLLEQVVDAMMELTDAERGVVVVRGPADRSIEVARELAPESDGVKYSRSVIERVMQSGEPVLSVDAASDERFDGSRSISHLHLRSVLAVPLSFRGELLGAAYVDHRLRRGNFGPDDLGRIEAFAELAALAVAHARALAGARDRAAELERERADLRRSLSEREAEVAGLRAVVAADPTPRSERHGMVGRTASMQKVFHLIDRVIDSDVPVVIHGESGTGKELVARALHESGPRRGRPFVAENCGAVPETLLESVLFGHARGAFTGAQTARAGLFEAADGGTIFLDEVGETSAAMQTKLLRVLQEGEIRRIGENTARKVDVRVVAASNRDLEAMVARGEFRRDLYYRVRVIQIDLPALRQRVEDIPLLVEHFLAAHDPERRVRVTSAAMRRLCAYAWPGNVRQLDNEVQRWVALCETEVDVADLSAEVRGEGGAIDPDDLTLRPRVDHLERELVARALERTGGNQTRAAELLGLSRFGLQKKLRRLEGG